MRPTSGNQFMCRETAIFFIPSLSNTVSTITDVADALSSSDSAARQYRDVLIDEEIKIWEDRKSSLIAILRPHGGLHIISVTFLTAPHHPDHIIFPLLSITLI